MRVLVAPPLRADVLAWQEQWDSWTVTVVCKATYDLAPGTSTLAKTAEPIHERDRFWDDDPNGSAYAPSDLAPFKLRPEIMLVGSAVASDSEPVQALVVRVMVGDLDKSIEVVGPRSWMPDLSLREGPRWTRMPLRYERAAGGPASWNPVGVPPHATDANGRSVLPHLQRTGQVTTEPGQVLEPVGFGPIAATWPVRRDKLRGELALRAGDSLRGARVGPEVDASFFQSAPEDQRVARLLPDQAIVLENLSHEHARLETRLAGSVPFARLEVEGAPSTDIHLVADTLWIDTDRAICTLVWRGQIPVQAPDQPCLIRIGIRPDSLSEVSWPSSSAPEPGHDAEDLEMLPSRGFHRLVELVWFDPEALLRVRETPAWRRLLAPPALAAEPLRDQGDLERILSRGAPTSDLEAILEAGDSRLCVVAGELDLPFDPVRMLEILSRAAASLAPEDKALGDLVQMADETMRSPLGATPDVAATFCARLREAWTKSPRPVPLDVLDANVRRVLLDERAYQHTVVCGDEHIHARLTVGGIGAPLPAYLPMSSARSLPLFSHLSARAIVAVSAPWEESDAARVTLRVVALARVVAPPRRP